jgi:NAD(P)-dependent dehydrogenase (short-subunit alcohol dehydrogenase family)
MSEPILVIGAAGFIGFHLARRLAVDGWEVLGIDNLNTYYDQKLKEVRLAGLRRCANFRFEQCDIADRGAMARLFARANFPYVAHLAAQAGVAHSAVDRCQSCRFCQYSRPQALTVYARALRGQTMKAIHIAIAALAVALAIAARQQPRPGRTVKLAVPYPPGGGTDPLARVLGPAARREVKNR